MCPAAGLALNRRASWRPWRMLNQHSSRLSRVCSEGTRGSPALPPSLPTHPPTAPSCRPFSPCPSVPQLLCHNGSGTHEHISGDGLIRHAEAQASRHTIRTSACRAVLCHSLHHTLRVHVVGSAGRNFAGSAVRVGSSTGRSSASATWNGSHRPPMRRTAFHQLTSSTSLGAPHAASMMALPNPSPRFRPLL